MSRNKLEGRVIHGAANRSHVAFWRALHGHSASRPMRYGKFKFIVDDRVVAPREWSIISTEFDAECNENINVSSKLLQDLKSALALTSSSK